MMDLEQSVMGLIINSGQAKSLCFEALYCAKKGDFEQAEKLLEESREFVNAAHTIQTQLIGEDEGEGKVKMTLIMVHAQDHLMTSMLAKELIEEIILLHKKIATGHE
jgi:PTS system cellobiose-specific IIA component